MNSGKCQYRSSTCSCPIYYDPATLCNQTIFAAYHRLDLIYTAIGFLLYLIMLLCYLFEMVLDTYRKKYTPISLIKGITIVFLLSRLVVVALWTVSSSQKTTRYAHQCNRYDHSDLG